jgi:hypothetical protein
MSAVPPEKRREPTLSGPDPGLSPFRRAFGACVLALWFASACISSLQPPAVEITAEDSAGVKRVFSGIADRNRSYEQSDAWLRDAYQGLRIKNLHDIPPEEFSRYHPYTAGGEAYVIVHPGYFPFFDQGDIPRPRADYARGLPRENLVDRITADLSAADAAYRSAREQERIVRDFIEFMAAEGRLVILVLPRDYRDHVTYNAVPGYDEYARYLNELSNEADNVVFLESSAYDQGSLRPEDLDVLVRFLKASGARTVMLGGGFIGKCLDGFYKTLRVVMLPGHLFYVPELTQFSPADMKRDRESLLANDGRIDRNKLYRYFHAFAYDPVTEDTLPWKPLPFYDIEHYR